MQFIVLDKEFQTLGVIQIFNTLLWYRRYYSPGIFELHIPAEYFNLINIGRYLYRNDRTELGVIREVSFMRGEKGEKTAYCKGFFAEHLLNNSVMIPVFNQSGTAEELAHAAINRYIINPDVPERRLSNIQLGQMKGGGTSMAFQNTGAHVGDRLYDMLRTQEMSQRLVYDYLENKLTYEVWQGLDRRDTQDINSWAVFSDAFCNIRSAQYCRDESDCKNFAYVAGEGEGADRKIIEVDIRTDPGEERRELYVDARDLQKISDTITYTDEQYEKLLTQRGLEKLADYSMIEKVDSDVDPAANLIYGVDFDLGDLCTYHYNDVNVECSRRITEIQEVLEGSSRKLSVIFGNDGMTNLKQIIRKEIT